MMSNFDHPRRYPMRMDRSPIRQILIGKLGKIITKIDKENLLGKFIRKI